MSELDEFLDDFLIESREGLDQIETDLVALEDAEADRRDGRLDSLFRVLHTIKGSAGFLDLDHVRKLAHAGEDLLAKLRAGELEVAPPITDGLLELSDTLRRGFDTIESTRADWAAAPAELIGKLHTLAEGGSPDEASPEASPASAGSASATVVDGAEGGVRVDEIAATASDGATVIDFDFDDDVAGLGDGASSADSTTNRPSPIDLDELADSLVQPSADDGGFEISFGGDDADDVDTGGTSIVAAVLPPEPAATPAAEVADEPANDPPPVEAPKPAAATVADQPTPAPAPAPTPAPAAPAAPPSLPKTITPPRPTRPAAAATVMDKAPALDPPPSHARKRGLPAATDSRVQPSPTANQTIRVDIGLLDRLMNLVGELVLTRNQLLQVTTDATRPTTVVSSSLSGFASAGDDLDARARDLIEEQRLAAVSQRLNQITTRLQDGIMQTRMQPIGGLFQKLPRIVRDVSRECDKKVHLQLIGEETELDKSLLEALADPLLHLVRNAVDHGIEKPAMRKRAGKPEVGSLLLRASHEGGQVVIEITDDGGGLSSDAIRRRALERGLFTEADAASMSDQAVTDAIFLPGFSTAESVTAVSGRGVGMDVVKTDIESIGGTVIVRSVEGEGMTVRIVVPLTLAIIAALVVGCEGQRYAIPQSHLVEVLSLTGPSARGTIEPYHDSLVYRLRDELLPLLPLDDALGLGSHSPGDGGDDSPIERPHAVVVRVGDTKFALRVDEVFNTQEIVVKPLSAVLDAVALYAGATIMGDGSVALILDILGLARSRHLLSRELGASASMIAAGLASDDETRRVLVCRVGIDRQVAIPVACVVRIEVVKLDQIERDHLGEVLKYCGDILPLVRVEDLLGLERHEPAAPLRVVVCRRVRDDGRPDDQLGLVVHRALDIELSSDAVDDGRGGLLQNVTADPSASPESEAGAGLPGAVSSKVLPDDQMEADAVAVPSEHFARSEVLLGRVTVHIRMGPLFDRMHQRRARDAKRQEAPPPTAEVATA